MQNKTIRFFVKGFFGFFEVSWVYFVWKIDNPFENNAWLIVYVRWKNERRSPHFRRGRGSSLQSILGEIFQNRNRAKITFHVKYVQFSYCRSINDATGGTSRQNPSGKKPTLFSQQFIKIHLATFLKNRLVMVNLKTIWIFSTWNSIDKKRLRYFYLFVFSILS